jgi:VIT1/CCC1 family predicted Fe2+/Mn2+ transporter
MEKRLKNMETSRETEVRDRRRRRRITGGAALVLLAVAGVLVPLLTGAVGGGGAVIALIVGGAAFAFLGIRIALGEKWGGEALAFISALTGVAGLVLAVLLSHS